ncbi:hypothetical protein MSG28_012707 [Choristoneura fumiferana]|uniref:Uncharacterized protein n=1 Tax=Choristoneura fumiferana TaxID=7141 RepID=A0ACC0JHM0_CHOFU|nr:hypothetical protein MSG28_012707 [Choristoneura fumiferana]
MDRCRCEEYAAAVEKLRFYTVGTLRPDIIDNSDRTGFIVAWVKHGVDYEDMKFAKPKARLVKGADPTPPAQRKVEKMWCPYMTPIKK